MKLFFPYLVKLQKSSLDPSPEWKTTDDDNFIYSPKSVYCIIFDYF